MGPAGTGFNLLDIPVGGIIGAVVGVIGIPGVGARVQINLQTGRLKRVVNVLRSSVIEEYLPSN